MVTQSLPPRRPVLNTTVEAMLGTTLRSAPESKGTAAPLASMMSGPRAAPSPSVAPYAALGRRPRALRVPLAEMEEAPAEAALVDATVSPIATRQLPLAAAAAMEGAPGKAAAAPTGTGLAAPASPRVQTDAVVALGPRVR